MGPSGSEGGCVCGEVRYRIDGIPMSRAGCCCRDCARATGAPYSVWVGVPRHRFSLLKGELSEFASSPETRRGSCRICATALTYARAGAASEADPLIHVAVGSLDEPDRFPPTEVVYYEERPRWFELAGDIPLHPGRSPGYGARSDDPERTG